jgi:hypothetical protein
MSYRNSLLGILIVSSFCISGCSSPGGRGQVRPPTPDASRSAPPPQPTPTPGSKPDTGETTRLPPVLTTLFAEAGLGLVGRVSPPSLDPSLTYQVTGVSLYDEQTTVTSGTTSTVRVLDVPVSVTLTRPVPANLTADEVAFNQTYGAAYSNALVSSQDGPHEFILPFSAVLAVRPGATNSLKPGCRITFRAVDPTNPSRTYQSLPYVITAEPSTLPAKGRYFVLSGILDVGAIGSRNIGHFFAVKTRLLAGAMTCTDRFLSLRGITASSSDNPKVIVDSRGYWTGGGTVAEAQETYLQALKAVVRAENEPGVELTLGSATSYDPIEDVSNGDQVVKGQHYRFDAGYTIDQLYSFNEASRLGARSDLYGLLYRGTDGIVGTDTILPLLGTVVAGRLDFSFIGTSAKSASVDETMRQWRDMVLATVKSQSVLVWQLAQFRMATE